MNISLIPLQLVILIIEQEHFFKYNRNQRIIISIISSAFARERDRRRPCKPAAAHRAHPGGCPPDKEPGSAPVCDAKMSMSMSDMANSVLIYLQVVPLSRDVRCGLLAGREADEDALAVRRVGLLRLLDHRLYHNAPITRWSDLLDLNFISYTVRRRGILTKNTM